MAYNFRPIILDQLGDPPPPTRAARDAVYEQMDAEFDEISTRARGADGARRERACPAAGHRRDRGGAFCGATARGYAQATPPQSGRNRATMAVSGMMLAAVAAVLAVLAFGGWYVFGQREQPAVQRPVTATSIGKNRYPQRSRGRHLRQGQKFSGGASQWRRRKGRAALEFGLSADKGRTQRRAAAGSIHAADPGCDRSAGRRYSRHRMQLHDTARGAQAVDPLEPVRCGGRVFDHEADRAGPVARDVRERGRQMARGAREDGAAERAIQQAGCGEEEPDRGLRAPVQHQGGDGPMGSAHCVACPESHSNCEAYYSRRRQRLRTRRKRASSASIAATCRWQRPPPTARAEAAPSSTAICSTGRGRPTSTSPTCSGFRNLVSLFN